MDMVFVYEDKIAQDAEGNYYTGSSLPQAVFDRYAGKQVEPALVRLILKMKFEEYMELIYGDYTMEEVKRLITQISLFSVAGFHGLLKELHTES